jgi:lysine-specific demethylase 8
MNDNRFRPLFEAAWCPHRGANQGREPRVFRGLAGQWPAVKRWTFEGLASQLDDTPVQLITGNREQGTTRFVPSTLRRYLQSLQAGVATGEKMPYLKEFDLLEAAPHLRHDLPHAKLLPRHHLRSLRSWIGPAGATTGLHHDYLDNLAVQVLGTKRWRLVRPGVVERSGAIAPKYDAWARLSSVGAEELAGTSPHENDFFFVDLGPGDVLHLPAGWWHEVTNLGASLLFGGFHGPMVPVLSRWAWVGARDMLHRQGWLARGNCTCHDSPANVKADAQSAA